ncbi:MAG TPA: hypothetical protein VFH51_08040 [Myxococcota bacterium]|nr:hypothetical protein [Myxococcota bacterium]
MVVVAAGAACGDPEAWDLHTGAERHALTRRCNGHVELCGRSLEQVSLPATHNAMSHVDGGWGWPNQTHGLTRQLEDGIRGLLLDTHYWNPRSHVTDSVAADVPILQQLFLCHRNCNRGAQGLVEGLGEIAHFLRTHPDEVVVTLLEDYIAVEHLAEALDAAGLRPYVMPNPRPPYLTLGELIDAGQRLLLLSEHTKDGPPWYPHAWSLMEDTPFTVLWPSRFGCDHNRGPRGAPLYLLNHWLSPPRRGRADVANRQAVLGRHVQACQLISGRLPTLVAVDFYDVGDLFRVVRDLNGLPDST